MSRQAIVGLFALLALAGLFGIFYVLSDFATRASGYRIGVHFDSAAGLQRGALVQESGVNVGTVDNIRLLPDYTVEVTLAIRNAVDIPRDSQFTLVAPLTGTPIVLIRPPKPVAPNGKNPAPDAVALLPREILPIEQQPRGYSAATIGDLVDQGQRQLQRVDQMLADIQRREPALLNALASAINNANEITVQANSSIQQLSGKANAIADQLSVSLNDASRNVVALTDTLEQTATGDRGKVDRLLDTLNNTATSLNASVESLRTLAQNTTIRSNLIETTTQIANTTRTIADITHDLRDVTGDPATKGHLKDTVANIDAASQRASNLLGQLGGTSSVPGVDAGATPYPNPSGGTSASSPGAITAPGTSGTGGKATTRPGTLPSTLKSKLGAVTKNLVAVQVRVSELNAQPKNANSSPLLTQDKGPQSDFNLIALPRGRTSLFTGVNDLGATSTWNFVGVQRVAPNAQVGAGILYSRLGVLGSVGSGPLGFEGRAYDLRRPTFDAYAHLKTAPFLDLFAGERDISHSGRRTVFGLQFQF